MNIEKLDRIVLSKEDVDLLFEWRDNHKDYVRNFKPVLKEGVIICGDYHTQVFKETDTHYHYTVFHEGIKAYEFVWNKTTKEGSVLHSIFTKEGFNQQGYSETVISLHASIMAYMEYYSDKKEYVDVREVETVKNKVRTKKKKKSRKSPVRIKKKVYSVNIDKEATVVDKRRYERKTEAWTVSGHWRHYKSGKEVWVEPFLKGKGEKTPKDYKL